MCEFVYGACVGACACARARECRHIWHVRHAFSVVAVCFVGNRLTGILHTLFFHLSNFYHQQQQKRRKKSFFYSLFFKANKNLPRLFWHFDVNQSSWLVGSSVDLRLISGWRGGYFTCELSTGVCDRVLPQGVVILHSVHSQNKAASCRSSAASRVADEGGTNAVCGQVMK